jgi:hypothetical protein
MWKVFLRRKSDARPIQPGDWTRDLIHKLIGLDSEPNDPIDNFRWTYRRVDLERLWTTHEIKCDRCHSFETRDEVPYWSKSETKASGTIALVDGTRLRATFGVEVDNEWVQLSTESAGWPVPVESMGVLCLSTQKHPTEAYVDGLLKLRPNTAEAMYRALSRATERGLTLPMTLRVKFPPDFELLPPERLMWARPLIAGLTFDDFCGHAAALRYR